MLNIRFEDEFLLVVEKRAGIHTAPLAKKGREGGDAEKSLLECVLDAYPGIASLPGRKACEPGLLHRLDRETSGLVLFAKTRESFEALLDAQAGGLFEKEYLAISARSAETLPGAKPARGREEDGRVLSRFRPYGPRGSRVAPIAPEHPAGGPVYETRVLSRHEGDGFLQSRLLLRRGFRHQVRAHLAWIGLPILGDPLYGPANPPECRRLMLHACLLRLPHPTGSGTLIVECPPPEDFRV